MRASGSLGNPPKLGSLGLLSLALVPIYHWQQWKVTTRTRKLFHVAVLAVYTSGLAFSPLLLAIASIGATLAMVGLEMVRVSRVIPDISSILTASLQPFLDSKEGGSLILTHIYLLVGVSWPLWLALASCEGEVAEKDQRILLDLGARLDGSVGCERFERREVRRHILADCCMRTSAGLHRADSRGG